MKTLLFIDDIRNPFVFPHSDMIKALFTDDDNDEIIPGKVFWAKNYNEFIEYITANGLPDIISFDHDLDYLTMIGEPSAEKTGMDCAKWLVDYCIESGDKLPEYNCHSQNPAGKQNILTYLSNYKRQQ